MSSFLLAMTLAIVLIGCAKKPQAAEGVAENKTAPAPMTPAVPDVGKADTVSTQAFGYGSSAAAATSDAMKQAILQVNGASIDTGSIQVKYGLDVTDGQSAASLRATEFAELVTQRSGGAITNFKVLSVTEPLKQGDQYKVSIAANIAHFTPAADRKRIKVVVAPVRVQTAGFTIGSATVPSAQVAEDIRQRVSVALTNTGRFDVLDRGLNPDMQQELDLIANGQAPRSESGKIGQAVTADVIWSGQISHLAYDRSATKLKTSDRELVGYAGGWAVSQKLVNVATREVMTADELSGRAPDIAPTTMGAAVDVDRVVQDMKSDISSAIVVSILLRTFPVTVVSRVGNDVVLSQGGKAIRQNARYEVAAMGAEMRDPQTNESLGRMETPCCQVLIVKVGPTLSYGHLENIIVTLDGIPPGGLQLRAAVPIDSPTQSNAASMQAPESSDESPEPGRAKPATGSRQVSKDVKDPSTHQAGDEPKW